VTAELVYPDDLPLDSQARIEQKLADAELVYLEALRHPVDYSPVVLRLRWSGFQPAVLGTLLAVAEQIVRELGAQPWPAARRRLEVTRLIEALPVARFELMPPTLWPAVRATEWWLTFQQTLQTSTIPVRPVHVITLKQFGQQLRRLRHEARLTVEQFAALVKLTRWAVSRHEAGTHCPSDSNLKAYERVLSEILGHPIIFDTPVKPSRPRVTSRVTKTSRKRT